MKVTLVMGTSAGGVGSHVRDLAGGLVAAGHDVSISCPSGVAGHFDFRRTGAEVADLEFTDRPALADRATIAVLRGQLLGADVVHAHGLRAGAFAALAVAPRQPLVVTLHNAAPQGALKGRVYRLLERVVARRADVVLGVSADLVARMSGLGARECGLAVVPAPAPRVPRRQPADVRAALGVAPGDFLIVAVGRLAEQKDFPSLLMALAELTDLPLHVAIAGDGPLRAELTRSVEEMALPVHLLGQRDDVPELLAAADAVVSTALWEGQPVWLQEALQAGAAIVATDAGGTAAVLGEAALVVPVRDSRAVAQALRAVVTRDGIRKELRAKARRRSAELPTQADAVGAALAVYAKAMT